MYATKQKKEAKTCDDENMLCSEDIYSYDMEEDNFDEEMPLKITKEWMSFVKCPWFLMYVTLRCQINE